MSKVRISNRPNNMPKLSHHFTASGKVEKLPAGPMILPRPGPTLATAVAAPVTAVTKSNSQKDKAIAIKAMVAK